MEALTPWVVHLCMVVGDPRYYVVEEFSRVLWPAWEHQLVEIISLCQLGKTLQYCTVVVSPCRFPVCSTFMSMKATRTRWCTLFPWLFRTLEMNAPKEVPGGTAMVELRGLGEVACYERASAAGMSYTSLRDVMAAQKRRPSTLEVDDLDGHWVNDNLTPRTPKSRLLEKAARAWLQPTACDRSLRQSNFFSRYWLKCTSHIAAAAPRPLQHTRSGANLSSCIVYFPFLRCFEVTPSVENFREPHTVPLLCC